MGFLLDTSALSAYLNPDHQHHACTAAVIDKLPSALPKLVSIITLAELHYGVRLAEAAGSTRLVDFKQRLAVIRKYSSLDITRHTSEAYAELKATLASNVQQRLGKKMPRWIEDWVDLGSAKRLQIDENDLWIAAQATAFRRRYRATYDARSHPTAFPAIAVRPTAALPTLSRNRVGP